MTNQTNWHKLRNKFFQLPFYQQKIIHLAYGGFIFWALYTAAGSFFIFKLRTFKLNSIDNFFIFTPWTFFIYVSYFFYLIITFLAFPDYKTIRYYVKYFSIIVGLHTIAFVFFPVAAPRPSDITGNSLGIYIAHFIYCSDSVANSFPSLHVTLTFFSCFVISKLYRYLTIPFFIWAVAIAISTMTTKQHYFYDVIAGIIIAVLFFIPTHKQMNSG